MKSSGVFESFLEKAERVGVNKPKTKKWNLSEYSDFNK